MWSVVRSPIVNRLLWSYLDPTHRLIFLDMLIAVEGNLRHHGPHIGAATWAPAISKKVGADINTRSSP